MSCPHAETTTLLWLHGELEPEHDHAAHVAECADCTAVLEAEEEVLAAVAPVAGALEDLEPEPLPAPANRPWLPWVAVAVAAVALIALGLQLGDAPSAVGPGPEPADTDLALAEPIQPAADLPAFGELDAGLDDLDLELAELSLEMETL